MRRLARTTLPALVICALLAALIYPSALSAVPTNQAIEEKREEAAGAQSQLDELQAQLELRTEEYGAITAELQVTRDEIADTRRNLEAADRDLSDANRVLEGRAQGIYRSGNVDLLEVLLGTTSFQDFLTRVDWLRRVNQSDAEIVAAVKEARARVKQAEEALERREADQILLRDQASVKKKQMEQAVAEQAAYLEGLNDEIASLVKEEQERQERLAEERARAAAEAARLAEQAFNASPTPVDEGSLGAGHPEALSIGLQYTGVPYVWGGSKPSGFDCSGLTQYVYAQIGISIPRTSRQQFRVGTHIPADRIDLLAPGDLVFFGYDGDPGRVHHVGIYAGSGDYLHAPQTGQNVQVSSLLERIATRADYVGASRL